MCRRLQAVLAVLTVALAAISAPHRLDAAEHHVTTSLAHEFGPVDVITSAGDHILLTGEIHVLTHATILEDGTAYFALHANLIQADGTGNSGTVYHATGAAFAELVVLDGAPSFPISWDPDFRLQPVGPSSQPSDTIRVNLNLTFSAAQPGRLAEVDLSAIWVP